jgi:predicted ATPase
MGTLGRLNRLRIDGFKSIRTTDIELKSLNLLIGPNGVGKSNFISLFRFMNKLALKDLQLYVAEQGGADSMLHFGRKTTSRFALSADFTPNAYSCELVPTDDDRFVFAKEYCEFFADRIGYSGGGKQRSLARPGSDESGLPDRPSTSTIEGHVLRYLLDWRVYHFHDTSRSARVKQTTDVYNNDWLEDDAGNLAAFLLSIRDEPAYTAIVETIQRVAPFFHDFVLEPEKANQEKIRLRWKHRGTDRYFDANTISDGTLRFICLVTLLLQPTLPTVILLDEPELGLHPYALEILAGVMRSVSARTQIIASTQSVTLANQFGWDDLLVVDRVDNASQFRRLEEHEVKSWLQEYGIGDLWAKNLIGGTPE